MTSITQKIVEIIKNLFKKTTTTTVTTTTTTTTFPRMYFIDPKQTPIDKIDFKALKTKGITDVLIRTYNADYNKLPAIKKLTDAAGVRLHAWVWLNEKDQFKHAKEVAARGIGVIADVETYKSTEVLPYIKQMRTDTKGQPIGVTIKPEGWDGSQLYEKICPYVDYIAPMMYLGDYGKGLTDLKTALVVYQKLCKGKIVPVLETYKSDKNPTAKDVKTLNSEIAVCKSYANGLALFRYGLSNYGTTNTTTNTTTDSTTTTTKDCYVEPKYKYVSQPDDYTCGPTSSVMALYELGIIDSVNNLAKLEQTVRKEGGGTGPDELISGIIADGKKKGVTLKAWKTSFDKLGISKVCQYLEDPNTTMIFHGMTTGWRTYYKGDYGHYVHPLKYCTISKVWWIADPDRKIIKYSNSEFLAGVKMISEANQVIVIQKA